MRFRLIDFGRLDERGLLGNAPTPGVLALVTLAAVLVLGGAMFLLGRLEPSTPGLVLAAVAATGLALAVGGALAVMQYRWAEQLEFASDELRAMSERVEQERTHHRTVVHDAKATLAALGAATHALKRGEAEPRIVEAIELQLVQLRATLDARSMDVGPFHVEDVMDGLRAFSALHDLRLSIRPTSAVVMGDASATLQILQNLVDNARKYAPEGTVRVWAEPAGDQHTMLVVEDDGEGIDPNTVELLFKPGVRRGSGQGYGMGLAAARQLAEAQGASLWYDASWHGARFVIKFPNAPELAT